MAFKKEKGRNDLSRLVTVLNNSQLQQSNNAAYQVIKSLIDYTGQAEESTEAKIQSVRTLISTGGGGGGGVVPGKNLSDEDFLTWTDESETFRNSKQLIAGEGIKFDDSIDKERIISVKYYDSPLTDGDVDETHLIFALGECIIVQVPV